MGHILKILSKHPWSHRSCWKSRQLGFAAGGSEFAGANPKSSEAKHPFGGGSGAGISLNPVAFLVVSRENVRLLPVNPNAIYDRLIDAVPQFIDQIQGMFQGRSSNGVLRTTYKV